ncbi:MULTISPECIES: class I SAM-dependent methyltransferase [Oxalobacteraceae]|uniref:class I SAM-dependent methyltransferase n=1 Tax=Herminiimonas sp. Marseille-P9896 TaxID=2742211 RepID=UPI00158D401E|nr:MULTISPECIES: class I SAM-dependent methyltransferase [Oxalobacteraceae]
MSACFEIKKCEVCGSNDLTPVLDLGKHPMCDDLIPVGNPAECETFPIDILYCRQCDTAHQKYQVPKVQLFPQTYHYRSRFTADVLSGMAALADSVEAKLGSLNGLTVLDVGCNDGSLLDRFSAKGANTIGVEPTGAYSDAEGRGHLIINDFFSEATARKILQTHPRVDIITFTNVFAHIEDLPALLKALSVLMNEDTILVVENHYLGAVLERNQFDTFYHEHPRTYSLHSFVHIAKTLGREVTAVEFPQRYGGNVRVIIGKSGTATPEAVSLIKTTLEREAGYFGQFAEMRSFIASWKQTKKAEIQALVKAHGKLLAKAFPGRAAILVALLDLSDEEVECVYEKPGSLKIGHYLPGTRIPIRSDDELFARLGQTKVLLNFAWHIPTEIEAYLRGHGYEGQIVHII